MTPSTAIGDAYTAPSSLTASMTSGEPLAPGMARDTPPCAASPWYIGQSGAVPAVPLAAVAGAGAGADGVTVAGTAAEVAGAGGAEPAGPEQPAAATASRAASAPARRLTAGPRSRCATPPLYHRPLNTTGRQASLPLACLLQSR